MPRPALTEEQRRETRRQIRQAASDMYAENGLTDISARAIAKRAGVSVGTIYSHFANLTELMQSLWRQPLRRLLDRLEQVARQHDDPLDRVQALLETYAEFSRRQQPVYRGAFLYIRPESHDKPRQVTLAETEVIGAIIAAVAEGQAAGLIRKGKPEEIAEMLWAGLHGAIALPQNIDRVEFSEPAELQARMIDLLMGWLSA